jgi:hypothetical protein
MTGQDADGFIDQLESFQLRAGAAPGKEIADPL